MELRIAIAEDMESERKCLADYIGRYAREHDLVVQLLQFDDGQELARQYMLGEEPGADLLLLDIDMARLDGISTARMIRQKDENVQIAFITRMVQHALEGYEVGAADYIVKPVNYELFARKMDRILRRVIAQEGQKIVLKTAGGKQFLSSREIRYAEASGKHVTVHLSSTRQGLADLTLTEPLYQLEKLLQGNHFFRCHSGYLINLRYVSGYSQTDVFLGETAIPLSKHRRKEFIDVLTAYHISRG
ncbi:MAG: response regulator transcription factor [Lachnospiraceae bacterium]|nr:response regulator transcription factor [Lachnospiraceae bacterium]